MIKLDHATHTYSNAKFPNVKYTSVTTVLGKYKDKFDEDYHAARVAERKGTTKEAIIAEWREINRQANEYGTALHEILERYLLAPNRLYSTRDDFEKIVINAFKRCCDEANLSLLNGDLVKPEHIMSIEFNNDVGLAGTADIIEDIEGTDRFNVWDFKTNKKFEYDSKYGEYLHFPINHLVYCQYTTYTLQLSIYALMYERETGKRFNRGGLFYWDKFSETFSMIPIVYMKKEVELLLEHYKMKHLNIM